MGDPGLTPWLVIALRVISNPCSNALQKALASHDWPAPVLLAFTHGVLGPVAMAILLRAGDSLGWVFWSWSLLSAALAVAANWLIIEAVRRSDLSLLGPINAYKPWVSLLPGWLLLGEQPVGWQWAGMALVLAGSLLLGGTGGSSGRPGSLFLDRGVQLRFLALVFSAAEAVTLKRALAVSDPARAFAGWVLLGFLVAVPFAWKARGACPETPAAALRHLPSGLTLALTTGIMQGCTFVILNFLPTGIALSFFQLSAVLSVCLGRAFFGEPQFARRLAGATIMALGAALLAAAQ